MGQDIYANNSNITIDNDSTVLFDGNYRQFNSSAIYIEHLSTMTFEEKCRIVCRNYDGHGVMYISDHSAVIFKGNSTVMFTNNLATDSLVLLCTLIITLLSHFKETLQ